MLNKNKNKGWLKSFLIFPLIFIPQLFASIILILLGFDLLSISSGKIDLRTMIFLEYIMIFFMLIILYFCMKYIDKEKFMSIGLDFSGRFKEFNFGIFLGFMIMAFAFSILIVFGEIVFDKVILNFKNIIMSIILFAGVSFYEEVIFRGYMLKNHKSYITKFII